MSTTRGSIEAAHRVGRQVWVAAIVTLLLVAALAVSIWAKTLDRGSVEFAPPLAQQVDGTEVPDGGYRGPHGPHATPKQQRPHVLVGPHGPNQIPKR